MIRSISELRLASLAFFIRGDRTCCFIPTSTVSFPAEESHRIMHDGFIRGNHSSYQSKFSERYFVESSSKDCVTRFACNG
jgi:hypothetical protein